ncbi:MAG: hypothetical protein ACLSA6_06655 [Holdemania massiliensis]
MKKIIKLFAVGLIAALTLTACGGKNNAPAEQTPETTNDTLVAVVANDPSSFHPDFKSDDNAWGPNQNIFNRLVKLNAYDQVLPDLAETWEWNEDSTQVTFHLHEA